jgi:hypothetical protein
MIYKPWFWEKGNLKNYFVIMEASKSNFAGQRGRMEIW